VLRMQAFAFRKPFISPYPYFSNRLSAGEYRPLFVPRPMLIQVFLKTQ